MPAQSVSEAVGDAAEAAVTAIGVLKPPGVPPAAAVPVARRKTPSAPEGSANGLPEIVVSVGEEPATEYLTATEKLRRYPVAVTIVTDGGAKAADDATVRKWRDQIDAALDARAAFASVDGFNQVDAGGGAPFDPAALPKDFNYSIQTFTVQVIEGRT